MSVQCSVGASRIQVKKENVLDEQKKLSRKGIINNKRTQIVILVDVEAVLLAFPRGSVEGE